MAGRKHPLVADQTPVVLQGSRRLATVSIPSSGAGAVRWVPWVPWVVSMMACR